MYSALHSHFLPSAFSRMFDKSVNPDFQLLQSIRSSYSFFLTVFRGLAMSSDQHNKPLNGAATELQTLGKDVEKSSGNVIETSKLVRLP